MHMTELVEGSRMVPSAIQGRSASRFDLWEAASTSSERTGPS